VTIVNCFTITKWTGVFVSRDIEVVTQLRKQEDSNFNKLFDSSINITNLDLLDAPLRNGYIIQNKPFEQNEWELVESIKNYLQEKVDGILLCPLAIGNHIDHSICREAVLQLYKNLPVLFYEDLPYIFRITSAQINMHIKELEKRLNTEVSYYVTGLDNNVNKEQAIHIYKSQINDEIVSEITSHMNNVGGERIWGEADKIDQLRTILEE